MTDSGLRQLIDTLRRARLGRDLSIRRLAQLSGTNHATLARLENGEIASPKPELLQQLAQALEIDVEDLYAAAGYLSPGGLPELQPYLRAKYGLGNAAADRMAGYLRSLQDEGGTSDDDRTVPTR